MSAAFLVADSGPLIALARLDLLGLPARYFDSVLVTSSVWTEVTRKPSEDEAIRFSAATETNLFRVVADPETLPTALLRSGIDVGERSALALGLELGATLLIDDRRARSVGAASIGTLGLLVRAREERFITTLRPLIERLNATGYFMPSDLVTKALASLGE